MRTAYVKWKRTESFRRLSCAQHGSRKEEKEER
jgi:hypothetical protein